MNWKVKMLDFDNQTMKMINVSQEDKALLRSNLSAWLMPGDGQEYMSCHMLLPFRSSSGLKAINLLSWCKAPKKAKNIITHQPVRHMSGYLIRSHTKNSQKISVFLQKIGIISDSINEILRPGSKTADFR
jgi:hypothetical protein